MPAALPHQMKRLKMADDALENIKLGFNRLLTAVGRRSTFTRNEFIDTDLNEVMDYIGANFLSVAARKKVRLRVVKSRLRVNSNAAQLETMVGNLVSNAVKYTPAGGRILVGCRRRMTCVEMHVIDTGVGMAGDAVNGLFEAFRQADMKSDGLGLGLWIVKNTAELLGIVVQIRSSPSEGTHFILRIPHAVPDEIDGQQAIQII